MSAYTRNDIELASYLMTEIAICDFVRYGEYETNWIAATSDYEDRFIGGFQVITPDFDVDSDFTFAYSLNGYYNVSELCDILDLDGSFSARNDFLVANRNRILFPDARKSASANKAFAFDYEEQVRPLLIMLNYDGYLDRVISTYDRMR